MAEVSYLLTTYNKAVFLPCVLESIRREHALTGGQIIILDDGSTDGAAQLCQSFAGTNPGSVLIEQKHGGIYSALNRILPLATAKWIRLCDGDAPLIPGSTDYLVEMAELDDATIAYGPAVAYGPEPLPFEALDSIRPVACLSLVYPDAMMHLIKAMDFTASRTICRADAAKAALPLPDHLVSCQDFALALRVTAKGRLARLRDPVCFVLKEAPNQLGASQALNRHQTIRILQSSRALLQRRHRNAAISVSVSWRKRELRRELTGLRFQLRKVGLTTLSAAARLGLYDWHRALDRFAAPYELQLGAMLSRNAKPS